MVARALPLLLLLAAATARAEDTAAPLPFLESVLGRATPGQRLVTIVAIHGLGDRPESFKALFDAFPATTPVRLIVPRGLEPFHDGYAWFPSRASGVTTYQAGLLKASDRLHALLAWLTAHRPTRGAPIVTGFSQGGMLSFALATRFPRAVGAAVPIAGWLPAELLPKAPQGPLPAIMALHGALDRVLAVGPTQDAVASLVKLGFTATVRTFDGVGHFVSGAMKTALYAALASAVSEQHGK